MARSLTLVVVLPLVLTHLDTPDISLWYIFSSIISLQILIDSGFSPTFSRVISFAMGGLDAHELSDLRQITESEQESVQPNWQTIERICSTMWVVYKRLTIVSLLFLSILGTWALIRPISISSEPKLSWIAWIVILVTTICKLLGNVYSSYLQGINKIALLRRWEIISSLGAVITSFIVLIMNGGLLGLVIANQSWIIFNIFRNRLLSHFVEHGKFKHFKTHNKDKVIFDAVWPSAWRSGLGIFMTYGLVQVSGIIYAQFGAASSVASYLLGLRLISMLKQFSGAPFYSKIPLLAKKRATGQLGEQIRIAKRSMALSYWVYVVGFATLGISGEFILNAIGSNVPFPSQLLWVLMGLAMLAERYGAMHIQLYSITNHIIWHIANGISGIIFIVFSLLLFSKLNEYAFPVALLSSYLGFYCWYSAKHSYKAFGLDFFAFEKETIFYPLVIILIYSCISFFILFFL